MQVLACGKGQACGSHASRTDQSEDASAQLHIACWRHASRFMYPLFKCMQLTHSLPGHAQLSSSVSMALTKPHSLPLPHNGWRSRTVCLTGVRVSQSKDAHQGRWAGVSDATRAGPAKDQMVVL